MEDITLDKNTMMQNLARVLNEKDVFNGAWLYAEKGRKSEYAL